MNDSLRRMKARLGIYERLPDEETSVDGLGDRIAAAGGSLQQERLIIDKLNSFKRALWHSYQGADINKLNDKNSIRALINPNISKPDYDDKILSVESQHGFKAGDIFYWKRTQTYWLIYLQDLTELAYFKGDIRRCKHKISWQDDNGKIHTTFAAIRGPVETKINFIQKGGNSVDQPNHSLNILMPLTEETKKYFTRYSKFYIQNLTAVEKSVCWKVEAVDWVSLEGVLEITAVEDYINDTTDNLNEGIVNGLIEIPIETESSIKGEGLISPKLEYTYIGETADWRVESELPIESKITEEGHLIICWNYNFGGEFVIYNGEENRVITVDSLF